MSAGGTITADSLDITGAGTPMDVTGNVTYDHGTITAPTVPIDVELGGTLSMTGATITGSLGSSNINGSFTASQLDYDRNGSEGVTIADPTAVVKIDNSSFHGTNDVGADMITANAATSLTMTYTEITKCHCAYHFNDITSFDLENLLLTGDSYGFMMYGSSTSSGTRVFKNSNVETMAAAGIDESGTNGAISVTGCYFDSSSKLQLADQEITITNAASSPLTATDGRPAAVVRLRRLRPARRRAPRGGAPRAPPTAPRAATNAITAARAGRDSKSDIGLPRSKVTSTVASATAKRESEIGTASGFIAIDAARSPRTKR